MEGLGHSNFDGYQSIYNSSLSSSSFAAYPDWDSQTTRTMTSNGGIFPTIPLKFNYYNSTGFDREPRGLLGSTFRGHVSVLNTAWIGS